MKYERLTFRHKSVVDGTEQIGYTEKIAGCYRATDIILVRLAELEDKIEQGTLIELPCKVGDTVYCVDRNRSACYECEHYSSFYGMDERCEKGCAIYPTIEKSKPICDKHFFEIDEIKFDLLWYGYHIDGFNKDWFTNREEAEQRLKELQE